MGVNFGKEPEMAFRNNFCGSKIRDDSGTCSHAQPGAVQMTLDMCVCDRFAWKTKEKLVLENSIDERDCQQHVGSERELSRTFPHRTQHHNDMHM